MKRNPDTQQKISIIKDFIKWARPQLGIRGKIRVVLVDKRITGGMHTSFGGFDIQKNQITLSIGDRHIIDCLRTLAHEMVHQHQHQIRELQPEDGKTGSSIENEANAFAGILMRKWADSQEKT
jgi:hypothetical protein